jgi:hypothetical protein
LAKISQGSPRCGNPIRPMSIPGLVCPFGSVCRMSACHLIASSGLFSFVGSDRNVAPQRTVRDQSNKRTPLSLCYVCRCGAYIECRPWSTNSSLNVTSSTLASCSRKRLTRIGEQYFCAYSRMRKECGRRSNKRKKAQQTPPKLALKVIEPFAVRQLMAAK